MNNEWYAFVPAHIILLLVVVSFLSFRLLYFLRLHFYFHAMMFGDLKDQRETEKKGKL